MTTAAKHPVDHTRPPWTNHNQVRLAELWSRPIQEMPAAAIAAELGRTVQAVIVRASRLNLGHRRRLRTVAKPHPKRSVNISGHVTSVSLESVFWTGLQEIAAEREISMSALIGEIDGMREGQLSLALRVYVAEYYAARVGAFKGLPAQCATPLHQKGNPT
jgi:predicted DNA-binding ribbon-helix-helix protein